MDQKKNKTKHFLTCQEWHTHLYGKEKTHFSHIYSFINLKKKIQSSLLTVETAAVETISPWSFQMNGVEILKY